ncbi:MAG: sulfite exporter TauE/SafE family protein [Alphaproteobacteria bacterium]|nr:sulfite exporter TauE/SafE family protein [Alphaproteobacteria bacterium]
MSNDFLVFMAVGFAAQLVDGAIGMAYGVISSSVLLSVGVAPATVSACVHTAETFTTGASGLAHWRLRNIDRSLVFRLAIPGMIGGAIGAYVLSGVPGDSIRPFISAYLLLIGLLLLWKAYRASRARRMPERGVAPLGFAGGLLDAIGGGGWGAVVTSTLLGNDAPPRYAIGSVNMAEFFVTLTISLTFFATIGLQLWPIIAGLVIGGVVAAPFGAFTTKYLPPRGLLCFAGVVVIILSCRDLLKLLS